MSSEPDDSRKERYRRIVLNPAPLKMVAARPGDPAPAPEYLVCRLSRGGVLLRASVHKEYCPVAPKDGTILGSGAQWSVQKCNWEEMHRQYGRIDDMGIEMNVWCPRCRGWSRP